MTGKVVTTRANLSQLVTTKHLVIETSILQEVEAAMAGLCGSISLHDAVVGVVTHVWRRVEVCNAGMANGGVVCVGVWCVLSGSDVRFPPPGQPSVFLFHLGVRLHVATEVAFKGEAFLAHLAVVVLGTTVDQCVVGQAVLQAELLPTDIAHKLLHTSVGQSVGRQIALLCKPLTTL